MTKAQEKEDFELDQRYRAVFGQGLPRTMLPGDWETAKALIERAIATRDDGVFEDGIPPGALI